MLVRHATIHVAAGVLMMREDVLRESLEAAECYPCGWALTVDGRYELVYPAGAMVAAAEWAVRIGRANASVLHRVGQL